MNMDDETAVLRSTTGESLALLGVAAKGTVNGLFFDLAVEQRYRCERRREMRLNLAV